MRTLNRDEMEVVAGGIFQPNFQWGDGNQGNGNTNVNISGNQGNLNYRSYNFSGNFNGLASGNVGNNTSAPAILT